MRIKKSFNDGWRFHKGDIPVNTPTDKGPVYSQSKTERKKIGPAAYYYFDIPDCYGEKSEIKSEGWLKDISVPHDYIIDQDAKQNENNALGFMHYDNAWYRKHFLLSPDYDGRHITLEFGGIAGKSTIYMNGCLVKRNFSSYNSFSVDITDFAFFDKENVLAIYVDTSEFEGWWYQGGGIYRDVDLVITDSLHLDRYGVYAPCEKTGDTNWRINFETTVRNDGFCDREFSVVSTLFDRNGKEIGTASSKGSVKKADISAVKYSLEVIDPILWDTEHPYLYTVKTVLSENDAEIDVSDEKIGFRTVVMNSNGIFLNGKKTFIKGVCCHQDFGLTGIAVPENIVKYKIKLIKDMGANGYRTSHYMNSSAIMDELDRTGMLVMDENRWFDVTDETKEQLKELVLRDRNRPSVILWSTGNEEPIVTEERGNKIQRELYELIRKYDKTRAITNAVCHEPQNINFFDYCDVIAINYNLDSYEEVNKKYPGKAILASECCATGTTRDWNLTSSNNGRIKDQDRDTNAWFLGREKTWRFLTNKSYVIGCYQWDSIEHRGESVWPALCSKSGAIDLFLQKKGAFYQNKSHWAEEKTVHIINHWGFTGLEGKKLTVTVYSNCEELELLLNGRSLERKKLQKIDHGEWEVPFESGELKAIGYIEGEAVCEDVRITNGKAEKLILKSEIPLTDSTKDVAFVTCSCVDKNGLPVYDAEEFVEFTTDENAFIVGTGSDTTDPVSVTCTSRKMYMGKISVAVRPKKGVKEIHLYAHSKDCGYTQIDIPIDTRNDD